MTLTEQWKKGELESGFYYVYLKYFEMFDIAGSTTLSAILKRGNENSIEVLAPVPSYEEWKSAYECQLMESEEVITLKKLLQECKEKLKYCVRETYELQTQIDNAIGEK